MATKSRKQQLEEMLAMDPDDPFLRYGLAMECISEGDDEGALNRFQALCGEFPDYVPAYLQGGQALLRLGRNAEAMAVFQKGIETARRQGDAHAAQEMQGFVEACQRGT
jgi:predicted Zn-dependent protease